MSGACSTKRSATDESDRNVWYQRRWVCLKDAVRHFKGLHKSRVRGMRISADLRDEATRMCQELPPWQATGVLGVALPGLKRRLEHGSDGVAARLGHEVKFLAINMPTLVASIPDPAASHREPASRSKARMHVRA